MVTDARAGAVDLGRAMNVLAGRGCDGTLSVEYEGFGGDPWGKTRRVVDVACEAFVAEQAQ